MNKYHIAIFLFIFAMNHICGYSQDFLQQYQKRKVRAYSVPIGATKINQIIGDSSKTYKITPPKFDKDGKLSIFQSDYKKAKDKITDHLLYEKDHKQGESMFFSVVINKTENKYFILVPGSLMGQLNFPCNANEQIKYVQVETANNNSFIFYIDNDKNDIETKIGKYQKENKINTDSNLNRVLPLLNRFYMIHYTYE